MLAAILLVLMPAADEKAITTDMGEIGKLLRKWHAEGTAAGNTGDWYDNRDGEHSPLDLKPWPQLKKLQYTPEDIKARRHWALQPRVLPHVVFGNSSTSAPPTMGGSNPMQYCTTRGGLDLLEKQYRGNNLYIYPEHRDHDPGHNGTGDGFGDLYPANTPYLIISQGSSGSDQPFMRAIPFTLAAFRPEVKKILIEKGLLMPTLQQVFRASNKNITKHEDYISGKAHPTVFDGSNVSALRMVRMAHDITRETIPPLVQLTVVEESEPKNGVDFYELPGVSEKLHTTPTVVARVWRGRSDTRTMKLTAKGSIDVGGKKLDFRWVLLRGDPKLVSIKEDGAEATITVRRHDRRPVAPGSSLESNRVDIGVFADNGAAVSAPAFVSWFTLDSEARSGRRIVHGVGPTEAVVKNWALALAAIKETAHLSKEAGTLEATVANAAEKRQAEKDTKKHKELDEAARKAQDSLARFLDEKRDPLGGSVRDFVRIRLNKLLGEEGLAARLGIAKPSPRVLAAQRKVKVVGKEFVGEVNGAIIADHLFPGAVTVTSRVNWVDPRLATPREWADTFDDDGSWVRRQMGRDDARFTPEGWVVTEFDAEKRPLKARTVVYRQAAPPKGHRGFNPNPLAWYPGPERIIFGYEDGKRVIKSREKVEEPGS